MPYRLGLYVFTLKYTESIDFITHCNAVIFANIKHHHYHHHVIEVLQKIKSEAFAPRSHKQL
jgi:hypothetical protein